MCLSRQFAQGEQQQAERLWGMAIISQMSGTLRDVSRRVTMWTHVEVCRFGADFEVTLFTTGGDRQALTLAGGYVDLHHALTKALEGLEAEGKWLDPVSLRNG